MIYWEIYSSWKMDVAFVKYEVPAPLLLSDVLDFSLDIVCPLSLKTT